MALGKTGASAIQYTPFRETSFGYGAGEIASAHSTEFPNGTDIVRVVINDTTGSHWDSTGHISTPSSGTAVSFYNSTSVLWSCRGERDDVDAVLAQLKLFPADYPDTRNWTPTALKDNQTTGNYGILRGEGEEEPDEIPDTDWDLRVYDENDTLVQAYNVTFEPIQPTFGNQRPYWSTEPSAEEKSTSYSTVDLGTISHGSDTENVRITAKAYEYGTTTLLSSGSVNVDGAGAIYVGDKKPATPATGIKFDITGSVAEVQAYMDNVRLTMSSTTPTFDLYMELTDGVVGSRLTKTLYQTRPLLATTFPAQSTNEDYDLEFDIGSFSLTNVDLFPEVNDFQIMISLDTAGQSAVTAAYVGSSQLTIDGNGVIGAGGTWSPPTYGSLLSTLDAVRFELATDYNGSFTFDLDITAVNTTVGSSYTMATQTITCTVAAQDEYSWSAPSALNWFEDVVKDFDSGLQITDNSFSGAGTYTVTARAKDNDGNALTTATWSSTSYGSATVSGTGTVADPLTITGSRSDVNTALQNLRMTPDRDWKLSPAIGGGFYFEYKVVRDNDGETTDFPNYTVATPFNMGAAIKELNIPSTIKFTNDTTAKRTSNDAYMTMKDYSNGSYTITESYTDDYTLTIYFEEGYNFYIDGVLQTPIAYVEADYVDVDYVEQYITYTGTIAEVESWLQSLTFIGSSSTSIYYILDRQDASNIDNGTITMAYVETPTVTSFSGDGFDYVAQGDYSPTNTYYDDFNTNDDNAVIGRANVTYSGDWNDIDIKVWVQNSSYTLKKAWTDSNENYDMYTSASIVNPRYTVTTYRISDIVKDATSGYFEFQNYDVQSNPTENIGEYEELLAEIVVSGQASNEFYVTAQGKRFVSAKNKNVHASTYDFGTYVGFYPYTVTDMSISAVNYKAYRTSTSQYENFRTSRYYFNVNDPDTIPYYINTLHSHTSTATRQDCLFSVRPEGTTTRYVTFVPSALTQSSGDAYGTLDNLTVSEETNSSEYIYYTTNWSADADIVDVYFDDSNNKFYALIANSSNNDWKLLRVDTLNSTDLNTSNGATVMQSGTNDCWGGSIGRLADGEIFFVIADGANSEFRVYHQNQGGTDNFGLQQSITKTSWGGAGVTFNSYFTIHRSYGSYVQANIKGWMLLGTFMYRWDSGTSTWVGYDSNEAVSSINSASALLYKQALSEDIVFKTGTQDFSTRKFFRIGRTGLNATDLYYTGESEGLSRNIQGSKRSNVFVSGDSNETEVYRFTK